MKKSFVYLICVLLMAAMLCGCGASNTDSGMVSSSPSQTLPTATATVMPTSSPMASADAGTGSLDAEVQFFGRRPFQLVHQLAQRERICREQLRLGRRIGHAEQQCRRIIAQI